MTSLVVAIVLIIASHFYLVLASKNLTYRIYNATLDNSGNVKHLALEKKPKSLEGSRTAAGIKFENEDDLNELKRLHRPCTILITYDALNAEFVAGRITSYSNSFFTESTNVSFYSAAEVAKFVTVGLDMVSIRGYQPRVGLVWNLDASKALHKALAYSIKAHIIWSSNADPIQYTFAVFYPNVAEDGTITSYSSVTPELLIASFHRTSIRVESTQDQPANRKNMLMICYDDTQAQYIGGKLYPKRNVRPDGAMEYSVQFFERERLATFIRIPEWDANPEFVNMSFCDD